MGSISDFLNNMDWWGQLTLLISAAAALLCITLHELSHGFVAWRLGDPTAKNAGRLTLNPIRHADDARGQGGLGQAGAGGYALF